MQIARALKVGLRVAQFRFGLGHAGLGPLQAGLGVTVVHHGQHLAGLDAVTGLDGKLCDAPAGLGRQGALLYGLQRTVQGEAGTHRSHGHFGHRNLRGLRLGEGGPPDGGCGQQGDGQGHTPPLRGRCHTRPGSVKVGMGGHGQSPVLPKYTRIPPGVQEVDLTGEAQTGPNGTLGATAHINS